MPELERELKPRYRKAGSGGGGDDHPRSRSHGPRVFEAVAYPSGTWHPRSVASLRRTPQLLASPLAYDLKSGLAWETAHYSWHHLPLQERELPDPEADPESRGVFHALLVDPDPVRIRALWEVAWSPEFTAALHAAIRLQAVCDWDLEGYDSMVEILLTTFEMGELLRMAEARTEDTSVVG